jgi:hypothetical protein
MRGALDVIVGVVYVVYKALYHEASTVEVEFLILADAVQAVNGKLYMLGGGWSVLHAATIPTTRPLGIALGLRVPWQETNQLHRLEIKMLDADGAPVIPPMQAQLEMGRPPGLRGADQTAVIAVNAAVQFSKTGSYVVQVAIEGQVAKAVAFDVVPVQPGPPSR